MLVGVAFFLFGQDIAVFLYGEQWHTAGAILPFLSVYIISVTVFQNVKHLLYSQSDVGLVVRIRILQSPLLVGGMLLILPKYGIEGAASMLSFLYLIGTGFALAYVKRQISIELGRLLLPPITVGGLVIPLFRFLLLPIQWSDGVQQLPLVSGCLVVVLTYFSGLWFIERKQIRRNIGSLLEVARFKR
jgi:O-antigen/teichoic acid export membrane protein